MGTTQGVYAKCDGGNDCCHGQCEIGEGDCDSDSDCLSGLKCDFDWWWGDDWCIAGPDTTNAYWGGWGDWSDCSISCGGEGTKTRSRSCVEATNGGNPCSSLSGSTTDSSSCQTEPCPVNGVYGEWSEWTDCSASCGGGYQTRTRLCDSPAPAYGGNDCEGASTDCQLCSMEMCINECPAM